MTLACVLRCQVLPFACLWDQALRVQIYLGNEAFVKRLQTRIIAKPSREIPAGSTAKRHGRWRITLAKPSVTKPFFSRIATAGIHKLRSPKPPGFPYRG